MDKILLLTNDIIECVEHDFLADELVCINEENSIKQNLLIFFYSMKDIEAIKCKIAELLGKFGVVKIIMKLGLEIKKQNDLCELIELWFSYRGITTRTAKTRPRELARIIKEIFTQALSNIKLYDIKELGHQEIECLFRFLSAYYIYNHDSNTLNLLRYHEFCNFDEKSEYTYELFLNAIERLNTENLLLLLRNSNKCKIEPYNPYSQNLLTLNDKKASKHIEKLIELKDDIDRSEKDVTEYAYYYCNTLLDFLKHYESNNLNGINIIPLGAIVKAISSSEFGTHLQCIDEFGNEIEVTGVQTKIEVGDNLLLNFINIPKKIFACYLKPLPEKKNWINPIRPKELIMIKNEPSNINNEDSKKQNFINSHQTFTKNPKIGIVTALPKEYAAVKLLLENPIEKIISGRGAGRRYIIGEIPSSNQKNHSVALALSEVGNNIAALRTTLLLEHFENIESIIMVGIAGGIPSPEKVENHIRLGDIVISNEKGVIQYDFDKKTNKFIEHRYNPRPPSAVLLEAVRHLHTLEYEKKYPWQKYIQFALKKLEIIIPSSEKDILLDPDNSQKNISHPEDPTRSDQIPKVFYGPIASANKVLKDSKMRDYLKKQFGVFAVEMESSGIADATWNYEKAGYIVIRGICDYCDKNKGDEWQMYAAIAAAAYMRSLVENMPA